MWFKNSAEFNVSSPFRIWPGLSYMVAIKQKTSKVFEMWYGYYSCRTYLDPITPKYLNFEFKSEGVYIYAIKHNFILSLK